MKAENILQSKLNKVKSFIDNESFVFTFPKTNAFAIHKDQLFKNQLYNTTIGPNGIEINTRKSSNVIKNEKINQILYEDGNVYKFLYNSGRVIILYSDRTVVELTAPDTNININGEEKIKKNKIIKILNNYFLTDNNEVYYYYKSEELIRCVKINSNIKNIFDFRGGIFVLTIENELFYINASYEQEKIQPPENIENFKFLKDIKLIEKTIDGYEYCLLFKTGKAYSIIFEHNNISTIEPIFENFEIEEIKGLITELEEDPTHHTHLLLLTKDGRVFGYGNNNHGQLGTDKKDYFERDEIVELKYGDMKFKSILATYYGSVLLSTTGKFVICGTFVHGEFGIYNNYTPINLDLNVYFKSFISNKLVMISRAEVLEDGEYKLRSIYNLKLFNDDSNSYNNDLYAANGIFIIREDGKLYYTGKNTGICGNIFGYNTDDEQNIDVWTPVESNINDIGRISTPRPDYWSYYFDYIMKMDKNGGGNSVENIFFKIDDIWIDWSAYVSKYMNVTLRNTNNEILKKYKEFKKTDNSILRRTINFDSFIEYLKLNKESIINEFKVDRRLIPQVDYIDKDLNVYTINAGDNISCGIYSQKDIDLMNENFVESLNNNLDLKSQYESVIENSNDPEEILEYQNRLSVINMNIEDLNAKISENQNKLGTMNTNNYLDFNDNNFFDPMTVVGTETKNIIYSKSNFSEPNKNGEIEIETEDRNGALHVVKSTVSKTVESNITKLKIDLINYDRLNNFSISDAEVLRDDIKMTIMNDPNDENNYEIDDLLIWLNGKFITKDFVIGNDNKSFCNYNGLASIDTRRICEFPGLGEPVQNGNNIPTIVAENATVIEPTIPTELRWDLSVRTFSWDGVKIKGPYKIHDFNNLNTELRRVEFFYFGDVYCSVFTQVMIKNKECPKNTFILFFDGAVVPEDEYTVTIKDGHTYITLKTFTAYVASLLQDMVDVRKPGYEGNVRHILSQFDEMNQFSIAFLTSTDKFKKVKVYYDYQTIRDVPKPGQILFNDIKYNDLILIDGYFIPYLWESRHCIRIPETVNTIRSSENSFIHHSTIYKVRPYTTYKKESELSDSECKEYARKNGLINENEETNLDISYIRQRVKPHIEAKIKEIL